MRVSKISVVNQGSGWWDESPIVSLHGGGGTGAQAVAIVRLGKVIDVKIVDGGVNYAGPPEVRFSGGGKTVGFGTEAYAEVAEGGKPFADQPVPKPENPPKEPKSTPPVSADTPHDEPKPMQTLKPKPAPDEATGQQHTEGGRDKVGAQFNPGGKIIEQPKSQEPPPLPAPPKAPVFQPKPADVPGKPK